MTVERSESPPVREEFLAPVRAVLRWLTALDRGDGALICPEHRLEHTGKNCGAAVLACELARSDPRADADHLLAVARAQGRRMLANLVREGASPCHTFRPGRHDPFNCSNSVIDGGACSDALAEIVRTFGPRLEAAERERLAAASLLHARTYLRYAVLDKGIPAQRAWGLTGLAAAWSLERDPVLEASALEAVGQLEGVQHPDGSFPYHPQHWGGAHPGSADVSAFYQSRCSAFVLFALERLERSPQDGLFRPALVRGLDFTCALQGPDGIKCGGLEAKPWYWGAEYEVASHPFDVYLLARGFVHFGSPRYAAAALRAFRAWAAHLRADGQPQSHFPGPGRGRSYQCPVFWAGHASWLARALCDLERCAAGAGERVPASSSRSLEIGVTVFPSAELARLEDGWLVAWVRGGRPPYNVHHGSARAAGLLRAVRRDDRSVLWPPSGKWPPLEGEWVGRAGSFAPVRGWARNAGELRFSLWLARNHWRGRRAAAVLGAPFEVAARGPWDYAKSECSSAFAARARLRGLPDGVHVESELAWRGGEGVSGSALERRYQIDGHGLEVEERLRAAGAARDLRFVAPRGARVLEARADLVRYRLE
jgi:hypothetical protein